MGRITRPVTRYHLFDLPGRATLRRLQPLSLVVGRGHARELTRRRPGDGTVAQRLIELGQPLEGFGHAETFLRPAGAIAKEAFDVFGEAAESEVVMDARSKGADQPGSLFPVEVCAALGESRQLLMYMLPVELLDHEDS